MKKMYAAILAVMILGSTAFAISMPVPSDIVPPRTYGNTDSIVFSGIAVSGHKTVPAVLVATEKVIKSEEPKPLEPSQTETMPVPIGRREIGFNYKNYFLIIGGKAYKLDLKSITEDTDKTTWILDFTSPEGNLSLLIKRHNHEVLASGEFLGYKLHMKLVKGTGFVYPIAGTQVIDTVKIVPTAR